MKKIMEFILGLSFLSIGINAQDITMDLGGQNHCGVFKTKPLKEFTKVVWKTKLDGYGGENIILYVSCMFYLNNKFNFKASPQGLSNIPYRLQAV
jgi:hypothetical protein